MNNIIPGDREFIVCSTLPYKCKNKKFFNENGETRIDPRRYLFVTALYFYSVIAEVCMKIPK